MGGGTPAPDPQIGIAARKSAETGEMMLEWMKDQSKITNQWATEDRSRYKSVYEPLQDQFIEEAQGYDTPERRGAAADAAAADVAVANSNAQGQRVRQAMSMGVRPDSGRFLATGSKAATDAALGEAGARNLARRQVEETGRGLRANAVNMGMGAAVNPATSMGISNGAASAGFSGAMQGYNQQGSLLNTQYQQQMQSYQAEQAGIGGLFGALGTVVGAMPWVSSGEVKHDKVPVDDEQALGAVRKMPVEAWTYNEGQGDGGRHIGPYAEDYAAATGQGDGSSIDPITMNGVLLGAVRALDKKITALAGANVPQDPTQMGAAPVRMAA